MAEDTKAKVLKIFLIVLGIFFVIGIYPMMYIIWPSGWGWEPAQSEYEQMIIFVCQSRGSHPVNQYCNDCDR